MTTVKERDWARELPKGCPEKCGIIHGVGNDQDKAMGHAIAKSALSAKMLCSWCDEIECDTDDCSIPRCECGGHYQADGLCGLCGSDGDPDPYGMDESYQRQRWQRSVA